MLGLKPTPKLSMALLLLVCGPWWLVGVKLGAQETTFSDSIAVTEVEVPVRVLWKGKPLAGLTRQNFEVLDKGQPQTITGFRVRNSWAPSDSVTSVRREEVEDSDVYGRRILFLFDFAFSGRNELDKALGGVRAMVTDKMQPTDRVAIATYGQISGLNLLVGFTEDRPKLHLALNAIEAMLDAKRERQRQQLDLLHESRFAGGDREDPSSTFDVLSKELGPSAALAILTGPVEYTEEDDGVVTPEKASFFGPIQVRVEVDVTKPIDVLQDRVDTFDEGHVRALGLSLADLATLLRDVEGQKDLVLLSEGFGGRLLSSSRSLFYLQKMFRAFRSSGWTLHAVDVGGVPGLGEPSFASNSLHLMSKETGGDLVENVNNLLAATDRILQRTGIVYVLSFQPTAEIDAGEFRNLEVRLRDAPKGAKIVHRPGYYGPRPPAKREKFEQRVDAADWLLTNLEVEEIPVAVYLRPLESIQGGGRVSVRVDVDGNHLVAQGGRRPTRLELRATVLDADRLPRNILLAEVEIDTDELASQLSDRGVRFLGTLALGPGDYELRTLVRSRRPSRVFLASTPLRVGEERIETRSDPMAGSEQSAEWLTFEMEQRSAYFQ